MDFAEMERQGWADAGTAQAYADSFAAAADMAVPVFVQETHARPGREVLDLCTGHGNVAMGLARAGASVTGLDFSPVMLDLARARVPEVTFVQGDAMNMPFDAGRFDAVAMGFGMPHVPDPPAAMSEARRVLRQGGRFAYSVWSGAERSAMAYVLGAGMQLGASSVTLPPGPGVNDFADPDRAFPAMRAAGFGDLTLTEVASTWTVDDPLAPYHFFYEGTVRGGALLRDQPEENARAIRQAVRDKVVQNHGETGPWVIPLPAVVISGTAL